jgi:hypothetical protein
MIGSQNGSNDKMMGVFVPIETNCTLARLTGCRQFNIGCLSIFSKVACGLFFPSPLYIFAIFYSCTIVWVVVVYGTVEGCSVKISSPLCACLCGDFLCVYLILLGGTVVA